ncbi:MAG: MBL fold metallo-hydrolase [Gammaproteobacteria bacterium]|nr:MBL fold metallo-hydrolase [Gammaproteobacteria bacterium]
MIFRQLFDKDTSTYTYLIADEVSKEAALIDTVREQIDRDVKVIEDLGLTLKYAIETHVHADHVTGAGSLRQVLPSTQVVVHAASEAECADILINDGDVLKVGDIEIKALYTPGHTNTCTSYQVDDMLFTGDALLIGGCGRTDFQAGDAAQLFDSIHEKFFTNPDSTKVYPGHDYNGLTMSTIGEEKANNPRLGNNKPKTDFVDLMDGLKLDMPKRIKESVPGNMKCGLAA